MHTPQINDFSKRDWDLYGGAIRFKDGSEPLIVTLTDEAEDTEVDLIADNTGITCITDYGAFVFKVDPSWSYWSQELARCLLLNLLKQREWATKPATAIATDCLLDPKWIHVGH